MKAYNELKALRNSLLTRLLNTDTPKDDFIKIRSQYYQVTFDLYFLKKKKKLKDKKGDHLTIETHLLKAS